MSKLFIDPNLYAQTDVDSGALTMLGSIVQQFVEPGAYRGTVRRGEEIERVFYLSVDKESPVAAADIDLARVAGAASDAKDDGAEYDSSEARFAVNPRGYVLLRVSGGRGGYSVNLRRADPDDDTPVFNSTVLGEGARFAARVLRPGTYAIANTEGRGRAKLRVSYPPRPFSGYRPPDPLVVKVNPKGFDPEEIDLKPMQGLIFECHTPSRIVIELLEPDDGPKRGDDVR